VFSFGAGVEKIRRCNAELNAVDGIVEAPTGLRGSGRGRETGVQRPALWQATDILRGGSAGNILCRRLLGVEQI